MFYQNFHVFETMMPPNLMSFSRFKGLIPEHYRTKVQRS